MDINERLKAAGKHTCEKLKFIAILLLTKHSDFKLDFFADGNGIT